MLLAFSALPEELEILLLSITYGNIDVENCLQNVVSMFFHIEKEIEWRKSQGKPLGFDTLRKTKPVVAIGPEHPLADQMLMADFFRESPTPPMRNGSLTSMQMVVMVWEGFVKR
jgi:inosine-uridine nucleoside N-ribohydrolase